MSVPKKYSVNHHNTKKDFVNKTYSGFKKIDIIKELNKSIKDGIIEQAITWSIEMILSGYNEQLWNKIINICSTDIHIYNPFLPTFLWNIYDQYNILVNNNSDPNTLRNNTE